MGKRYRLRRHAAPLPGLNLGEASLCKPDIGSPRGLAASRDPSGRTYRFEASPTPFE
jgi:hypothetical protein